MEGFMRIRIFFYLISLLPVLLLTSCTRLFEEDCPPDNRINFMYLNENERDETTLYINSVTDYIFNSDSILYRVDPPAKGSHVRSRGINLPDGKWIIVSLANQYNNTGLSAYTTGETHLKDLLVRVTSPELMRSSPPLYIGSNDKLYFSSLNLEIRSGLPQGQVTGYYTPAHAQLTVFVTWEDAADIPRNPEKLSAVLQGVPTGFRLQSSILQDRQDGTPFSVPLALDQKGNQHVRLYPSGHSYRFDAVCMRFETGKVPYLQLMDDFMPLTKPLDLNEYFNANNIDLSNSRIQNFSFSIRIDKSKVIISPIHILTWDVENL
ncbi:hypothetical protein AE938_19790 [Bacteroides fragilis]|nr:hypothetical protein [Bacteroides fragilis]MBY2901049.1 hypothetical protein [Bacteroides fragilis]